ncbi:hypothetical protein L915_09333 [Phytophthora nicotianae]|uniref:Uncharacterized protein n=1 Tax=Phytophthora nicotianae TaxID=4792 RepID=W2GUQ2_PHYNI|nr:hypothetical protein L915_09333 [Phytophthora nicotianae]
MTHPPISYSPRTDGVEMMRSTTPINYGTSRPTWSKCTRPSRKNTSPLSDTQPGLSLTTTNGGRTSRASVCTMSTTRLSRDLPISTSRSLPIWLVFLVRRPSGSRKWRRPSV